MNEDKAIKLNIGCGRKRITDFINIDVMPFVNGNNEQRVDIVMDIEKELLPYKDGAVEEIRVDNVLEHIGELKFFLNECHRVLSEKGILKGMVPVAGSKSDFRDPTHKRHFIIATFAYFIGESKVHKDMPSHPKYANYGFLPWNKIELQQEGELIFFELSPRKINK